MLNAAINGGTLSFSPGSSLLFTGSGNFNNVTVNGDLDVGTLNITGSPPQRRSRMATRT